MQNIGSCYKANYIDYLFELSDAEMETFLSKQLKDYDMNKEAEREKNENVGKEK